MIAGLLDDFLVRAALGGVGAALAAGPLGCFVVWRRMAYFGDATAHAAILGVALALATGVPVLLAVLLVSLVIAVLVSFASGRTYAMDTMLGVAAHGGLALGLVAVAFMPGVRLDLVAFLFGDILAVGRIELAVIWLGAAAILGMLVWRWNGLLLSTLSPDLATAEGRKPEVEQLVLVLALSALVAVALKVVGALLITAMLIIPPAAARALAGTPEAMAGGAAAVGVASALGGLWLAYQADTPAGPSIVVTALGMFVAISVVVAVRNRLLGLLQPSAAARADRAPAKAE